MPPLSRSSLNALRLHHAREHFDKVFCLRSGAGSGSALLHARSHKSQQRRSDAAAAQYERLDFVGIEKGLRESSQLQVDLRGFRVQPTTVNTIGLLRRVLIGNVDEVGTAGRRLALASDLGAMALPALDITCNSHLAALDRRYAALRQRCCRCPGLAGTLAIGDVRLGTANQLTTIAWLRRLVAAGAPLPGALALPALERKNSMRKGASALA